MEYFYETAWSLNSQIPWSPAHYTYAPYILKYGSILLGYPALVPLNCTKCVSDIHCYTYMILWSVYWNYIYHPPMRRGRKSCLLCFAVTRQNYISRNVQCFRWKLGSVDIATHARCTHIKLQFTWLPTEVRSYPLHHACYTHAQGIRYSTIILIYYRCVYFDLIGLHVYIIQVYGTVRYPWWSHDRPLLLQWSGGNWVILGSPASSML